MASTCVVQVECVAWSHDRSWRHNFVCNERVLVVVMVCVLHNSNMLLATLQVCVLEAAADAIILFLKTVASQTDMLRPFKKAI